jgi:hypothetical protein
VGAPLRPPRLSLSETGIQAVVLALAALGVACSSSGSTTPVAVSRASVVGGEPSPAGIEDAVLMLRIPLDGGELVCSSSLVAPNLVVTARHCVSHFVDGNFSCTVHGELQSVEPNAGVLGSHFDAPTIEFYDGTTPRTKPIAHGAQVLSTLSDTVCTNDLAFVVLDRSLALPVLPLRLDGRARIGEPVTLVGYGFDDDMVGSEFLDVTTQRRTHNTSLVIDEVGPVDNDDVTSTPPRTVVVRGPSGCVGDSGGPLMARDTHALLGIDSLSANGGCLAPAVSNLFTHVPDFELLLADAFAAAGDEPVPEMPADEPGSEAGRGGAPSEVEAGGAPATAGSDDGPAAGSSATQGSRGGSAADPAGGSSSDLGGAPASAGAEPASDGGASGAMNTGGDSAGSGSRVPSARPRSHGGCGVVSSAPPSGAAWWLVLLVAVFERVFHVRRRGRVSARGNAVLRCGCFRD